MILLLIFSAIGAVVLMPLNITSGKVNKIEEYDSGTMANLHPSHHVLLVHIVTG